MKLYEISSEVSKHQFVSAINGLVAELHSVAMSLEKMIDDGHGDIVLRHLRSRQARWFSNQFPTILSAAASLKHVAPVFTEISRIGVTGFTSSSGNSDLTKSNGFHQLIKLVYKALERLGATSTAAKLQAALDKCDRMVDAGKEEQMQAADFAKQKAPKDPMKGQQISAAEMMVNQVIKDLPPDLQHKARAAISKADNKLKALQQFLDSQK